MIKTHCLIPGCNFYDKVISSDRKFVFRHYARKHGWPDLVKVARKKGITNPEKTAHHILIDKIVGLSIQ